MEARPEGPGGETGGVIEVQQVAVHFEVPERQPAVLNIYQVGSAVEIAQRFRRVPAEDAIDIPDVGITYPGVG